MNLPIHPDAVENFKRALVNDGLLGICDTRTDTLYLALAEHDRRASDLAKGQTIAISQDRWSQVLGTAIPPLPGAGGHSKLASNYGLPAQQVAQGVAVGPFYGFSIVKTGYNTFVMGTTRSGVNQFYDGSRPSGARDRTLPQHATFSPDPDAAATLTPRHYQRFPQTRDDMVETTIIPLMAQLTALMDSSRDARDLRRTRSF